MDKKNNYIAFTLDLSKIPDSEISTTDKNGEPFKNGNRYVKCIAFINEEPDQFGNIVNVMIKGKKGDNGNISLFCCFLYYSYYYKGCNPFYYKRKC